MPKASASVLTLTILVAMATAIPTSHAQTLNVLHNLEIGMGGSNSMAGLTMDRGGNLYGTTNGGNGTVFRLSPKNGGWIFTTLYEFQGGQDGSGPTAPVTIGPDGAVYGTTLFGGGGSCVGNYGCGIIFKLTPSASTCHMALCPWTETVVYRFAQGPNGVGTPWGTVSFDAAGNMYGQAFNGGTGSSGAIYKLAPSGGSWIFSVIYNYTGGYDGAGPTSGLTVDRAGNLYGTAFYGGAYGFGTIFELVRGGAGWTFNVLYAFQGANDGGKPFAGVVMDNAGNLYGDNQYGGVRHFGVVYQLSHTGSGWTLTPLYSSVGSFTVDVTLDSAGNVYGTTYAGGIDSAGSVFELSNSGGTWTETDLHSFTGLDGALPYSTAILDASGNLYGTTTSGGRYDEGVVWQITR